MTEELLATAKQNEDVGLGTGNGADASYDLGHPGSTLVGFLIENMTLIVSCIFSIFPGEMKTTRKHNINISFCFIASVFILLNIFIVQDFSFATYSETKLLILDLNN